jgi:cobalt/nickel transport system permease protein
MTEKHAFLDKYSDIKSPVHQLDPRAKLVALVFLIVLCVSTPPNLYPAFAAYLGLEVALVFLSRLPLRHVFRRMLVVLPFILVVAAFLPFFNKGGGSYNLGPLTVSSHGLMVLWNVAVKSTVSVLAVILLSSTTPFPDLLRAMEKMRVPRLLTTLLSFTYRYIFVLMEELQRMRRARDSRGWSGKWLWQARVIGHMIAALFLRSY